MLVGTFFGVPLAYGIVFPFANLAKQVIKGDDARSVVNTKLMCRILVRREPVHPKGCCPDDASAMSGGSQ